MGDMGNPASLAMVRGLLNSPDLHLCIVTKQWLCRTMVNMGQWLAPQQVFPSVEIVGDS